MKKRMVFVLTLALALCGCGSTVETSTSSLEDTTAAETTAAETTVTETTQETDTLAPAGSAASVSTTETGGTPAGHYTESINGKGSISLTQNADGSYRVIVRWAGAATEEGQWVFSGTFDADGVLSYNDCVMDELSYEEDGSFTVTSIYTHGSGTLTLSGDTLYWHDEQDKVAEFCKFVKR